MDMDLLELSRTVLEQISALERAGEARTPGNLARYLGQNGGVKKFFESKKNKKSAEDLKLQGHDATQYGNQAFQLLREAEEEIAAWQAIVQKIVITLTPFIRLPKHTEIHRRFSILKELITNPVEFKRVEDALESLKSVLMSCEAYGYIEADINKVPLDKEKPSVEDICVNLKQVMTVIQEIVPDHRKPLWKYVTDKVEVIHSLEDLEQAWQEVIRFFLTLSTDIKRDHTQLQSFIEELGKNLVEIERHIITSFERRGKIQDINKSFQHHINSQIVDLQKNINLSKNLEDLRKIVLAKVFLIKKAVEERQKHEETYEREIDARMERLQKDLSQIQREIHSIQAQKELLEQEALTDPLTMAMNRRAYEKRLREEWECFKRYDHVFSILMIDIDRFKDVNDYHGHIAGDLILKELTRRVKNIIRKTDLIFRYGGEEFVILLPGTSLDGAQEVAEKIRKTAEVIKFLYKGSPISIRLSIGVTQVLSNDRSSSDVFDRVDAALYRAKSEGRNRVVTLP